jgi:NitT/TauT family transport system ATP-binding protein
VFRDRPKHDIAMIFQDYAVFPWMTVIQNINFALKLRQIPYAERNDRARFFLNKVGLSGVEYKYPSQLSGGMRQRLALARALSVEPKIILMDEPFAAVDALTREKLQDDLIKLWEETKVIIVMVTHDTPEAVYLSDEIIVFSPSPGTIRNRIRVNIPRPRRRSDPEIIEIQERIFALFQYDLKQESEYSI